MEQSLAVDLQLMDSSSIVAVLKITTTGPNLQATVKEFCSCTANARDERMGYHI
jgi:hypothetical protein